MSKIFPKKEFMEIATSLAKKSEGKTHPNPCVGAVVVKKGKIVGKGFYLEYGKNHAEVEALLEAKENAKGADLYVTLEPCQIYGKTPPCTQAIIQSGIKRVIVGIKDPNPRINGKGINELRENNIEVIENFMYEECLNVDKPYHIFHSKKRPFVHLKWAQSIDGVTVLPEGGYLSGFEALKKVHRHRFLSDAILVTSGTIKRDKPQLTIRHLEETKPLLRLVADVKGIKRLPESFKKSAEFGGEILVFRPLALRNLPSIKWKNISTIFFNCKPNYKDIFYEILRFLRERKIISLYVEAIGNFAATIVDENLVDKISIDISLKLIGKGKAPNPLGFQLKKKIDFSNCSFENLGSDMLLSLEVDGKCLQE